LGCRFGSFRVFEATQSCWDFQISKIMKKEIKELKDNVWQITTWDERFYAKSEINKNTGLPEYKFVPSVTWIAGCYPKGIGFINGLLKRAGTRQKPLNKPLAIKEARCI